MPFDFPNSPSVGQRVTGVGGIVYVWDGVKWTNSVGGVTVQSMGDVGRNLIHNPLFNVAQRGVGPFTTNNAYTADRWWIGIATDTLSASVTSLTDTDRSQIGDESAWNTIQAAFTGNAAAGASSCLTHGIEDVRRLANKTATLSFWAKAAAGTPSLGTTWYQNFGSGGSPSAVVLGTGVAVTLSTTWTRYTRTIIFPSISGKTLGTNGDHSTNLRFAYSSGATNAVFFGVGVQSGTISIWGVQLEIGSVATPLEKPDPRYDLSNCQRFYSTVSVSIRFPGQTGGQTNAITVTWAPMRAGPTITQLSAGTVSPNAQLMTLGVTGVNSGNLTLTSAPTSGDCYVLGALYSLSADL